MSFYARDFKQKPKCSPILRLSKYHTCMMTSLPVQKLVSGRIFPKKSISSFSTYFHFSNFYHIGNATLIPNMSLYFAYRKRWRHSSLSKFSLYNPLKNWLAEVRNYFLLNTCINQHIFMKWQHICLSTMFYANM